MQFAFRWQSYDSLFCMNKIVRRYRDLLIANLSGSCIFSEFFPGNEAVVQTSPTAPRSRKTVRFGRVEFFNDSQVLAYARSATNELSSPPATKTISFHQDRLLTNWPRRYLTCTRLCAETTANRAMLT
jgi:hypothetical protein